MNYKPQYKIAFIDSSDWDYDIESPYEKPFGGSTSALCYLAEELVANSHNIYLFNNIKKSRTVRGVHCYNFAEIPDEVITDLDVAIILNQAEFGFQLRAQLSTKTVLILWTQHDIDQPAMQTMYDSCVQNAYDGIAFVSNWQREQYHRHFNVDLSKSVVMRNAIAPTFADIAEKLSQSIPRMIQEKSEKLTLVYTSTPFRGLDLLIEIFPKIRQAIPDIRLQIFSSMKVYQVQEESDYFKNLYNLCQQTEGVEYIGSLPQPDLAKVLQRSIMLAYPNTFPETSCIAVMEAMASGCHVVTSALGALPETAGGFADLVDTPVTFTNSKDREIYKGKFAERVITILKNWQHQRELHPQALENSLKAQLDFVRNCYTWKMRAQEWHGWLEQLIKKRQNQIDTETQEQQQLIKKYEALISQNPQDILNYIHLVIQLLLQRREEEARMTWFSAIAEMNVEDGRQWQDTLAAYLAQEALVQKKKGNLSTAEILQFYLVNND